MATDIATLAIKVENGDVVKATTSLNTMAVAGDKTEKATQRLTRRMALLEIEARQMDAAMTKSTTTLGRVAATMGLTEATTSKLTTALGAFSAIAAVGFIGRKTLEETEAAQAAMAQLEAAVTSTGGAAGRTVAQLDALSLSLQKTTTFSDEAVKGAEAMLLTFNQIRGDEFDRATAAVTDLAARMGGDLSAAAVQVGKALQDPTTGLTALRRSGVSFSAAQIEVIRKLYETGRAAEGQRVILKELEQQFGGSAAAARDTLGGALTGLNNAWGDLFEVSRGASQGTVTAINAITTALEGSGLSMNKVLKDATIDWETMRASIEKVKSIMSLQIDTKFLENARNIIQRIDFDLSAKIADLNKPAKAGPLPGAPPPRAPFEDKDAAKKAAKDLEELQRATDKYYNTLNQHQIDAIRSVATAKEQNAETRAMIAAYRDGPVAVEALTIAQAGETAVKELGVGASERMIAARRREGEEAARLAIELGHVQDAQADARREAERAADEAQRGMERRAKELHRTVSSTIEGILTDIDNRRNPFVAIFDNLKRGAIRAISDVLATKIEGKIGDIFGITMPASKQEKAGVLMNTAADKMLAAAGQMNGVPGIKIAGTDTQQTAMQRYAQQFLKAGAAGYGGFQTGYGIGAATGSKTVGAIGGAASGFMLGNAILPGIGGVVGGLAGLAGGILGAGDAAEQARERMRQLKEQFQNTFDALRAELNKDTLGQAAAQVQAQYDQARQQLNDTLSVGALILPDSRKKYFETYRELQAMEAERIAQLQEEARILGQRRIEDFQQRLDEATPGNERAEAIAAFNRDRDRELEDLKRSFGSVIDAQEAQTYAVAQAAIAAEKEKFAREQATASLNAFTTAVRNAPTGFKLEPYIQQYAKGAPFPGQFQVPTNPFVPPTSPMMPSSPTLSRTGTVATAPITITNPTFVFPNVTDGKVAANAFLEELDKTVAATGGLNTTRADALNRMPKVM